MLKPSRCSRLGCSHASTMRSWRIRRTWVAKYFTSTLKAFAVTDYRDAKADLFACFIERNCASLKRRGLRRDDHDSELDVPVIISSELRKSLSTSDHSTHSFTIGRGVFGSDFVAVAAFVIAQRRRIDALSARCLFRLTTRNRSHEELNGIVSSTASDLSCRWPR